MKFRREKGPFHVNLDMGFRLWGLGAEGAHGSGKGGCTVDGINPA